jgi:pimeloyl-ACP methyl ester carboxylesterase
VAGADLHIARHHVDATGLPIVLVHGSPDRSRSFSQVIELLSGHPVTAYDRRGYGGSLEAGGHEGGFDTHADDLIDLLDGSPSVVIGTSAGGAVSLLAASRRPELFLSLGVWEPPMTPWDWWVGEDAQRRHAVWLAATDTGDLGESMIRTYIGDRGWDALSEATKARSRAEGAAFLADMRSQAEPFFDLAAVTCPTVLGAGTKIFSNLYLGAHRRTAERLGAEFLLIEGADHYAHTSRPGAWVGLVHRAVALAEARQGRL